MPVVLPSREAAQNARALHNARCSPPWPVNLEDRSGAKRALHPTAAPGRAASGARQLKYRILLSPRRPACAVTVLTGGSTFIQNVESVLNVVNSFGLVRIRSRGTSGGVRTNPPAVSRPCPGC